MKVSDIPETVLSEEQSRYAGVLEWFTRLGLGLLSAAFLAYATGLLPGHVPIDRLPELWGLPAGEFLARTETPAGWGWIQLLGRGDMLNLAGIGLLAGCSMLCLASVLPIYLRRRERFYVAIVVLQIAVLVLAAWGILGGGH